MNFTSTAKTQVRSEKVCVLFDPSDGTIHHVHRVVTMEGTEETPERDIEKRAHHLAREFGLDAAKLHALHVDGSKIEPNTMYTVDAVKRRLVAVKKGKMPGAK
jgi:hypothetical protein